MRVSGYTITFAMLYCGVAWLTLPGQGGTADQGTQASAATPEGSSTDQARKLAAQLPVARLSRLAGSATVQTQDGTSPPIDAALNMPLPAGERLSTAGNGEAEVEFADGSVLRMTPRSDVGIERMDAESHATALQIGEGLIYLELRASDRSSYTVSAAELQIAPEGNASFRLHLQDGQVEAAVLAGSISVTRANAYTVVLQAGESLRTDPRNGRRYLLSDSVSSETWDSWNERLAQAAQDEQTARTAVRDSYAGDQAYGWADLDANGNWYNVPGEGQVWQPTLADAGFDPYGSGAWVYGPGGYAWASSYAWGWLPYRCGAWSFYQGFGWGWSPASGCLSFGFGGGYGSDGGSRVHHPPTGWHPPQRPVSAGELQARGQRHPTLPVTGSTLQAGEAILRNRGRSGRPVRVAGGLATPVTRIGPQLTPQGGSAVGSSLLRDFPVRPGTHDAVLGIQSQSVVATPGRPADWHRAIPGNGPTVGGFGPRAGAVSPGSRIDRGPLPTDPPLGATGAPPFGANGPPPLGAVGRPGVGAFPQVMPRPLVPVQPRVLVPLRPAGPVNPGVMRPMPAPPAPRSAPPPPPPAPRAAPAPSAPSAPATVRPR